MALKENNRIYSIVLYRLTGKFSIQNKTDF